MTKLPVRVPTSSILLAVVSLGLMRVPSLRPIRIAISVPVRRRHHRVGWQISDEAEEGE